MDALNNTGPEQETEATRFDKELALLMDRFDRQSHNQHTFLQIKRNLCRHYGFEEGARRCGQILGSIVASPVRATLRGLHEFAQTNHCLETVFFDNVPFSVTYPRQFGKPTPEPLQLQSRCFFLARLENAIIANHSDMVRVGKFTLADFQNEELQHIEVAFDYDPWVVCETENCVWLTPPAIIDSLPEAISLVGSSSFAFGHWMAQYLPKLAVVLKNGLLPGVPIIVDADMPSSHYESLELFLGIQYPIIKLPYGHSLRVERLWLCSTPGFIPVFPMPGQVLGPEHLSAPPVYFADLYRTLLGRIPNLDSSGDERIYLARKPERHRKLVNADEVEAFLKQRGYVTVYPEKLSFTEQVRLIHAARKIVGPEGSQLILTFFAQPGTQLCILNHPFLENIPTFSAFFEALGVETWVMLGDCELEDTNYRKFSNYRIDLNELAQLLDSWD